MMVRCNMCGWEAHEENLLWITETEHQDGTTTHEKYKYEEMKDNQEILRGCPNCLTDGYLMDIREGENKK